MLRWMLIALIVLFALRLLARAASGPRRPISPPRPKPLSPEERARLERERERALLEGRQIDAIKIHRQLTGLGLADSKQAVDEMRRRAGLR